MEPFFQKFKSNLELDPTLAGKISTRHLAIREYLKNNHPGFKEAKLIGSNQRKTRIHPGATQQFDIDIIVVVGEFHNWVSTGGIAPHEAINALHATINESPRYLAMNPVHDAPTIKLTDTSELQVELVPAYLDMIGRDSLGNELGSKGRGYWIAKNGSWHMADYDHEADWISSQNASSGGDLIPIIKMLKAIKRAYFPELGSFQLEIMAAQIIPDTIAVRKLFGLTVSYGDLIQEFFDQAPARLGGAIQIPGSKSAPMYLDPTIITKLATTFKQIGDYIRRTSSLPGQGAKVNNWRRLCGEHFPVTI